MSKKVLRKALASGSSTAVLAAMLLAACGGQADNGAQSKTAATTTTATTGVAPTPDNQQTTSSTAAGVPSEPGWTYCADEGGTCSFSGTRQVRYGADGKYAYKTATTSIGCNNTAFGDPNPGVAKYCWYSTSPAPYNQDASQYSLTFSDEFDGTALNTTKWNDHIWYDPPSDTKDYVVENGLLKIFPQADANGKYNPRILTTKGKFAQTYGYFEMEAKLPVGSGPWPAFQLLNSDNPDAGEPQINIMEAYSGDKTGYWANGQQHPIRYNTSWYRDGYGTGGPSEQFAYYTGDLSTGYHKYGLKWEPTKLSFYFDGKLVHTVNVSMSKNMYLLVDMKYGDASGSVDSTTPLGKSNAFAINYVRAWKFNTAPAEQSWTYCADEWGTCSFSGTRQVRYGADGKYAYKTATTSIGCDNTVFGDPNPGVAKHCWYSTSTDQSTTPTSPAPYNQDASQYSLTFSDEFDGTALNTAKWNDHIWYDPPSDTKDYVVENGLLKIFPQADANGNYKERILTTKGKFAQTYGYFEMEAKLPVGDGPWPAFWLLNSDNPDAGEPEIDIMEAYSGDKTGYWADGQQHPIRYGASWYRDGNGTGAPSGTSGVYTGDLSTGYHKYGLKWEPTKLSFYFDGKLVHTVNVSMSKNMYLLVDMKYGDASGSVDSTTPLGKSNAFAINYVRAWKFK